MKIKEIEIDGNKFQGFEGEIAPGTNLVFIKGSKGFIMCGYLNMDTADKFNNIAAIAVGVKCIDDMLNTKIVKVSAAAKNFGINEGMPVKEALLKLNC
ncbi:MAG: DUF1805 domain-containing protein [Endomicrobium sp.]|nr:DUF1805 domain-containing protein [Endomicrobium sp.]